MNLYKAPSGNDLQQVIIVLKDDVWQLGEGLERKTRSAARICSVKPDPQGHAPKTSTLFFLILFMI